MRKIKLFTIQRKADKYTLAYFVSKKDCVEYLNRFIVAQFLDHYKSWRALKKLEDCAETEAMYVENTRKDIYKSYEIFGTYINQDTAARVMRMFVHTPPLLACQAGFEAAYCSQYLEELELMKMLKDEFKAANSTGDDQDDTISTDKVN